MRSSSGPFGSDRGPTQCSEVLGDLWRTVGRVGPSPVVPNLLFQSPSHYHRARRSINNSLRVQCNKFPWESQSDLAECLAGPALNKSLIYCTWPHWLWLKGWMWSSVMEINAACMCADACTGLFCICEREKESIPKCKLRVSSLRNAATKTQEISQSATVERRRCWPAACI